MAQQQQQRPGQAQGALDQLQAMLNLVLSQVGDMLSSPAKRKDPQRRFQLHQSVPIVNTKFQEALDRFEDEIFRSKAVMRRDLALHIAAKQKEKAALAEKEKPAPIEKQAEAEAEVKEGDKKAEETKPTAEAPATSTQDAKPATTAAADAPPSSVAPDLLMTSMSADPFTHTSPTTADVKEFDFDSMFEDLTNTPPQNLGDNAFDAADQPSNVFDQPLAATQADGGASGDMDDVTDMSSLLRGIEGYANIGTSAQTATTTADQQAPATTAQGENEANASVNADAGDFDFSMLDLPTDGQDGDVALGANSFDELFGDFEFADTATGNGSGGDGGDGLDEDWLKEFTG